MISKTFGGMLFYPESDCLSEFPSPEEMKYRVIISTKPPKEYLEQEKTTEETEDHSSKKRRDSDEEENQSVHKTYFFLIIVISFVTLHFFHLRWLNFCLDDYLQSESDTSEHNKEDCENKKKCDAHRSVSGAPAYKRLIAIHAGKRKGGLKEQLKVESDKVSRLSLNEQALERATSYHGTDVVRYILRSLVFLWS